MPNYRQDFFNFTALILALAVNIASSHAEKNIITPNQVITPGITNLSYQMEDGIKVFHLTAEPVTKTI